ncbi:MAG: VWA-like domain-containing protein [Thiobacillus sp.]|jgi:predicted metal-dependent peptidase
MAEQLDALQPILTKLAAARTRLIMERPFLGSLVMHLPLKPAAEWCSTTATDAQAFYFNPGFIEGLSLAQTQFVLAHEAMHCAMGHTHRRQHRIKRRWDVACDHAVNLMLIEEGLKPPLHGILANQDYLTLSAEEIYPMIPEDTPEESFDQHLFDNDNESGASPDENQRQDNPDAGESGGQGKEGQSEAEQQQGSGGQPSQKPDDLSPSEREDLAEQWKNRLAAAAQAARQAGKLSQTMLRWVDDLLAPSLPWRALLARFFAVNQRDDYSWRRPSRREGEALLPRLSSEGIDVIAAIDTSGSISDDELREFVSELDALKGQVRARVTLLACDNKLATKGPWEFEPWDAMQLPDEVEGGGGTDFRPVFDWVEHENRSPNMLVYFTDAEGDFPKSAPNYPVIWLVKGKGVVPWGERVQLN